MAVPIVVTVALAVIVACLDHSIAALDEVHQQPENGDQDRWRRRSQRLDQARYRFQAITIAATARMMPLL